MFRLLILFAALGLSGCAALTPAARGPVTNPILVTTTNEELVWERAVDVLHRLHFRIARENRLGRVIETEPRVGSGVLEPWHHDAVGLGSRLEGTLQSVRRIVHISMQPSDQQTGYLVSVSAYKEIEDLPGVAANSPGAATFAESTPLERDLNPVVGETTPSGWVPAGRDVLLEQTILAQLMASYSQ